jgi:hypothetical protein
MKFLKIFILCLLFIPSILFSQSAIQSVDIVDSTFNSVSMEVGIRFRYTTLDSLIVFDSADSITRLGDGETFTSQNFTLNGFAKDDSLYEYIVQAFFADATTNLSSVGTFTTLPIPTLTNLRIIDSTYTNVTFEVHYADSSNGAFDSLQFIDDSDSTWLAVFDDTTGTVTGLTAATSYSFRVVGYIQETAFYSNIETVTTLSAPTITAFDITDSTFNSLDWVFLTTLNGNANFSRYEIILASDSSVLQSTTDTLSTVRNLAFQREYVLRARGYDENGVVAAYSNLDTMWTVSLSRMPVEAANWAVNEFQLTTVLDTVTFNSSVSAMDTLTLLSNTTSSTFFTWNLNSLLLNVFRDGGEIDSAKAVFYIYQGIALNDTQQVLTLKDSVVVDTTGVILESISIDPISRHFFIEAKPKAGAGFGLRLVPYLIRWRDV